MPPKKNNITREKKLKHIPKRRENQMKRGKFIRFSIEIEEDVDDDDDGGEEEAKRGE